MRKVKYLYKIVKELEKKIEQQKKKADIIRNERIEIVREKERKVERLDNYATPGPADYLINTDYLYKGPSVL